MEEVRLAHLPGNYELYDEATNLIGPPICKHCWEEAHVKNSSSLDTVWLTVDGWNVVCWLCKGHHDRIESKDHSVSIFRSESRVVRNPVITR